MRAFVLDGGTIQCLPTARDLILYIKFQTHGLPTMSHSKFGAGFTPQALDELAQRLGAALPSGLSDLKQDVDKNLQATLKAGLAKLDLVTREEFEIQRGVLLRTREKLEALEDRVTKLEAGRSGSRVAKEAKSPRKS